MLHIRVVGLIKLCLDGTNILQLQETRPVVFDTANSTPTAAGPAATNTTSGTDSASASAPLAQQWAAWLRRYQLRLLQDTQTGVMTVQERRMMMDTTNPKYVLRCVLIRLLYLISFNLLFFVRVVEVSRTLVYNLYCALLTFFILLFLLNRNWMAAMAYER